MKKTAAPKIRAAAGINQAAGVALPRLEIGDGTIEGIKWLALLLMMLDHVNKHLLHNGVPALFAAGRLAMPLFAFVLAFNLARPGVVAGGGGYRALRRLALAGAIASIPFVELGGLGWGWWPLNIMAMLAVTVGVIQCLERGGKARLSLAVLVFVAGGAFVEFWWIGVAIGVAAWSYCRRPNWAALLIWIGAVAALFVINRNWWALATLPLIFAAPSVRLSVPRLQTFFYAFYPAHLAMLWLLLKYFGWSVQKL